MLTPSKEDMAEWRGPEWVGRAATLGQGVGLTVAQNLPPHRVS